ncbi:MAG: hypothetical protein AAF996_13155 [Pseudomonadota bacterium]
MMTLPRIRQLVFASLDQGEIETLRYVLGLGDGFVDPGVAEFGLTNGVFAIGDQFLEVVVPTQENTAAGRFLARSQGVGGYMAIFQTDNLNQVRETADARKIRRVWNIDLPDISASHLHPADIGAAIVSIDEARPEGSWRWGGPKWEQAAKPGVLIRLDVTAIDPEAMSEKWGAVLNITPTALRHDVFSLQLSGGSVRFIKGDRDHLNAYQIAHPDIAACLKRAEERGLARDRDSFLFAGVRLELTAIDPLADHAKTPD